MEKKNIKGMRQPNLNSSALHRHTRPPAVCREQNTLRSALNRLKCSGLFLQLVQLQEWIIVGLLKSDLILHGFSAVLVQPASI